MYTMNDFCAAEQCNHVHRQFQGQHLLLHGEVAESQARRYSRRDTSGLCPAQLPAPALQYSCPDVKGANIALILACHCVPRSLLGFINGLHSMGSLPQCAWTGEVSSPLTPGESQSPVCCDATAPWQV